MANKCVPIEISIWNRIRDVLYSPAKSNERQSETATSNHSFVTFVNFPVQDPFEFSPQTYRAKVEDLAIFSENRMIITSDILSQYTVRQRDDTQTSGQCNCNVRLKKV